MADISTLISAINFADRFRDPEVARLRARVRAAHDDARVRHHAVVVSWAEAVHTLPQLANASPVDLAYRTIPRRLGTGAGIARTLEQDDLLTMDGHVAVLGNAGAGKTTTLRQLALLLTTTDSLSDLYNQVVLVVCREAQQRKRSLFDELGEVVGISGRLTESLDNPTNAVLKLLEGSLILIDGLDEVPAGDTRDDWCNAIQRLARTGVGKLVVSCRSADWPSSLEGFETAEIQPLTSEQIRRLLDSLFDAGDAQRFLEALDEQHAISDLADRPLLLVYMAKLFLIEGRIPDRPSDLLRRVVNLLTREWNDDRRIRRSSAFPGFDTDAKIMFLSELAWRLLQDGLTRFSTTDFNKVYERLFEKFQLPSRSTGALREIESHNGLLVEVGGNYEFAHRTIQEFLAAEFVVRSPEQALTVAFRDHPAVAAIAVAMSSDSAAMLQSLLQSISPIADVYAPSARSFLVRLASEQPRLAAGDRVGQDLLKLLRLARFSPEQPNQRRMLTSIGSCKVLTKSIIAAIRTYGARDIRPGGRVYLSDQLGFLQAEMEALLGADSFRQVMAPPIQLSRQR